jgi:hypothetical protein
LHAASRPPLNKSLGVKSRMSLAHCYRNASSLLASAAEPYSVVECVEQHRLHWRPAQVHTILLAESHVYTQAHESVVMSGTEQLALANSPTKFVRLVYCLGYGEPNFVGQRLIWNTGTWQYWKLLASCARGPTPEAFAPVLKRYSPSFHVRLQAKIALLDRLRQLGVWLLDASILALYSPGATRLHAGVYERLLRCCWEHHIGPTIADANPHSVIVIGRGVHAALRNELKALSSIELHAVPQPQARISAPEISAMHALIHQVCQSAAAARGVS